MSRSYKKNPYYKDNEGKRKRMKRIANKKVRKNLLISDGKSYKRYFCSYDIVDYRSYCPYEKFQTHRRFGPDLTKDDWERWYRRK